MVVADAGNELDVLLSDEGVLGRPAKVLRQPVAEIDTAFQFKARGVAAFCWQAAEAVVRVVAECRLWRVDCFMFLSWKSYSHAGTSLQPAEAGTNNQMTADASNRARCATGSRGHRLSHRNMAKLEAPEVAGESYRSAALRSSRGRTEGLGIFCWLFVPV